METGFLILLLIGFFLSTTPIGISFIATTMILTMLFTNMPLQMILSGLFAKLDSFPLLAVLFFIFLGNIMNTGKSAEFLVDFAASLVRRISGGLGIASVIACAIFGAISGSAPATIVAIGGIAVPAMIKANYNRRFSISLITASGILGIIVPPSILLLLYAVQANVSIARLFMGGVGPAALIVVMLSIYTYFVSKKEGYGITSTNGKHISLITATKRASWALAMPVVVLGGIYGGIFTPTEAAVVGCVYALIIESFVYKTLTLKIINNILTTSGVSSAGLLITLAGATVFSDYLTVKLIPQSISIFFLEKIGSPILWLALFNILFLFLGCWIDPLSAIMVVTPLLVPSALAFNIDPVFLGVLMTINLGIGYVTPPLGANLYISSIVFKEPIFSIARSILPMTLIYFIALVIITFFPSIVLFLPNLVLP